MAAPSARARQWAEADRQRLAEIITEKEAAAADALLAIQHAVPGQRLVPAAFAPVAELLRIDVGSAWVRVLERRGLLDAMAGALADRGVETGIGGQRFRGQRMDEAVAERFLMQAARFRCRLVADGEVLGSGVLVGPTLVLTAWHVVAAAPHEAPPAGSLANPLFYRERLEVLLPDRRALPVQLPPVHASACHPADLEVVLAGDDAMLAGHDDVALLRLDRPAPGAAVAKLAAAATASSDGDSLWLVDYPYGRDEGIAMGSLVALPGFSRRFGHAIETDKGSSGGGCFNSQGALIGLHQAGGRLHGAAGAARVGRMVPVATFHADVMAAIDRDNQPYRLWSLDGTPRGELVLGRHGLFAGFAAARHGGTGPGGQRIRGVWTRRADPTGPAAGAAYTFCILEALTARDPEIRLCRISFEKVVDDVVEEIRGRAAFAGFRVDEGETAEKPGAARGETAPEAGDADRARRLALALDREAALCGLTLCFFIDSPHVVFGDRIRSGFEAFVDQLLGCAHLRLVIAGFETVGLGAQHFASAAEPSVAGKPGLVWEDLTGLKRDDIATFLDDAIAARARGGLHRQLRLFLCRQVLRNLAAPAGVYGFADAGPMIRRLRPIVRDLAAADID